MHVPPAARPVFDQPPVPEEPTRSGFRLSLPPRASLVPWVVATVVAIALASAAFAVTQATKPSVHVPNLVGGDVDAAGSQAGKAGLLVEVARRIQAADPAGTVVGQDPPPGESMTKGSEVSLVISTGPPPVALPNVVAQASDAATKTLQDAGFEVAVDERFHDTVEAGRVVNQTPQPGKAPEGSTVRLVVSKGPRPVVVPNVVNLTSDEAGAVLIEAGFEPVVSTEYSDTVDKGHVIRQNPVSGQEAIPGSQLTLVVSKGPNTVRVPDVRGMSVEDATGALRFEGLEADIVNYEPKAKVKRQDPSPKTSVRRGTTVTLFL